MNGHRTTEEEDGATSWAMTREHWSQMLYLLLVAGSMLAGATYFIVAHIDGVQASDQAAISTARQDFSNSLTVALAKRDEAAASANLITSTRVTTLENHYSELAHAIDRLSTVSDQQRTATMELRDVITKLTAVQDRQQRR